MPSTPLRRHLRGLGHALAPVVQLGKLGTTPAVEEQTTRALLDHELIKIKLGTECPETRFAVAEQLGKASGVNVVQILGRTILLYKRHPKDPRIEKPKFDRETKVKKPVASARKPGPRVAASPKSRTQRSSSRNSRTPSRR